MTDSWRQMLTRAKDGDAAAIDKLVTSQLDPLRAFIRARMGRLRERESSLDLAQSVCRELLRDLPGFEPRGTDGEAGFRRWLLVRAVRKLSKRGRFWGRAKRVSAREVPLHDAFETGAAPVEGASPSRAAAAREDLERLRLAFARLDPDQREVIVLARVLEMPHEKIAALLGRSVPATWSILHRALARLSSLLVTRPGSRGSAPGR